MPKFAANLSFMFQDKGFLDRFDAAARAGFKAVEFLFPYDHPPETIAELLARHRLSLALFNTVAGDWAGGERGLAALPGREQEFRDGVDLAIIYAKATRMASASISTICAGPPTGSPHQASPPSSSRSIPVTSRAISSITPARRCGSSSASAGPI